MQLGLVASGLLFESVFTETPTPPGWIITPSVGAHTWDTTGLKLTGNAYVLHQIPTDIDFTLVVEATATPGLGVCGLVLYRENNYQIRLSAFDDAGVMPTLWAVKRTEGVYIFMVKIDTAWQVVGSIRDELFLYIGGFAADGASLKISHAWCTQDEDFLVQGLSEGHAIRLSNMDSTLVGQAIAEDGTAIIELGLEASMGITGRLQILDSSAASAVIDGPVVGEVTGTFWPGDAWTIALPVSIKINSTVVPFGKEYTITSLEASETVLSVDIQNESTEILTGRKIRVMSQTPYFGVEWADVAPDVAGVPGVWADEAVLPDLAVGATVRAWVRVLRNADTMPYTSLRLAKFRVVFT